MAEKPTDTPDYGCVTDLAAQQAATAEAPKKGKTAPATEAAPAADSKE